MAKTSQFVKNNRIILIVLAVLLLCGIAAFIAYISLKQNETPQKAVYVYRSLLFL